MFSTLTLSLIILAYMTLLFALAIFVERRSQTRKVLRGQNWVYGLSLAVFFTSWTFYGSVGFAVENGLQFFAIYIGAIIGLLAGSVALKRMVLAKENFRITSIADMISTRYRRSQRLAALVSIACIFGLLPYIVLQLQAITDAYDLLSMNRASNSMSFDGLALTLLMATMTIAFGVRRLDPTERHQGIIAVLVAECIVKLVAFLAVGYFVTFEVFNGLGDILLRLNEAGFDSVYSVGQEGSGYTWIALILLGASAILLLPRQFHVAVVENASTDHIRSALTLFPIYTILINIFVIPVAGAGLLLGLPASLGDQFVLLIPQFLGNELLTLLVFIGGFSAATGMVIVTTLTLATMASNHLIIPVWRRLQPNSNLSASLLQIRWALVIIILLASHLFATSLKASHFLVTLGLISFAAILQLAPAGILGLFWRKGNSMGATLGLLFGYATWFFTLVIPTMVPEGWASESLLTEGLLGIHWLRPEALFGFEGLPSLAHSVFWSLVFNISFYIFGSLLYKPQKAERVLTAQLFECMIEGHAQLYRNARPTGLEAYVLREPKITEAENLLHRFFNGEKAEELLASICIDLQLGARSSLTIVELMEFHRMLEQRLAGSIGVASAHAAFEESIKYSDREAADLRSLFSHLASELNTTLINRTLTSPRSKNDTMGLLRQVQKKNDTLEADLIRLKNRCETLEKRLDNQYRTIFDYRVETQKLRVDNEVLREQLIGTTDKKN